MFLCCHAVPLGHVYIDWHLLACLPVGGVFANESECMCACVRVPLCGFVWVFWPNVVSWLMTVCQQTNQPASPLAKQHHQPYNKFQFHFKRCAVLSFHDACTSFSVNESVSFAPESGKNINVNQKNISKRNVTWKSYFTKKQENETPITNVKKKTTTTIPKKKKIKI